MKKITAEDLKALQRFTFVSREYAEATGDEYYHLSVFYSPDIPTDCFRFRIEFNEATFGEKSYSRILKKLNQLIEKFDLVQIETEFDTSC